MTWGRDLTADPPVEATERWGAAGGLASKVGAWWIRPVGVLVAVAAIVLLMGWQFMDDPSGSVPAVDTAWYQWRAEYTLNNDPADLVTIKGAEDSLAGGYRVAEPVLAGLMRVVGDVGPETPAVVLSVFFRVLAAVGLAAFAWKHRRSWLLFYLTLFVVPALFLLQQFFGFMDNFFSVALMAGVLLLLEPMRTNWVARVAVIVFLLLAGLSHPTTLAVFLLAIGAVAVWRFIRERSLRAVWASEGPIIMVGMAAVIGMVAVWMGGRWGPTAGLNEAAVPPPQPVDFFVDRSLGVLDGMYPQIFVPILIIGLVALTINVFRTGERFSEITVAWTLPLVGMFGFVAGAAYPYFRFFNATLAPLLVTAVGFAVLIGLSFRFRRPPLSRVAPIVVAGLVAGVLFAWWNSGITSWSTSKGTWLTPEVRETTAAADAYLASEPAGRKALFVVDAQREEIAYSEYKKFTNSTYAGLDGERIDDSVIFYGDISDLEAGQATTIGDEQYDAISSDTAGPATRLLDDDPGNVVVFVPSVFNDPSPNTEFVEQCASCEQLSDSGLYVVPEVTGAVPVSEQSAAAARAAAEEARAFVANPPGALDGLGGNLWTVIRLALLLALPGYVLLRLLPGTTWVESLALVPILSVAAVTLSGVLAVALVRGPLTDTVAWWSFGAALFVIFALVGGEERRAREAKGSATT